MYRSMTIGVANIIEEGKLGGPQVRITRVASALQGRVETIVIMPSENSESFRAQCDAMRVPYRTFHISRVTKEWQVALRYILFSPFEIARLVSFFRKGSFDLVHVSGGSWQYKGVIAGKLAGLKVVWHLNDTSMPWLFRQLFVVFSRFVVGYIFASKRSKEYYGSMVRKDKPEFVIPAPVDTGQFDPGRKYHGDEDLIAQWMGKTVIGTVANINPIKGLEVLIRAAAALNERYDNLLFVVVGPTYTSQQRYFKKLQQLCERLSVNNVEFVGGRGDVRPLLQRFDIYVCSSRAESSPISVWEAMGMGRPVVSTDVGDVPLYVRDGYNGFIVDVENSEALAERLATLITNEDTRLEFGRRARRVAIRELDIEKCARLHLDAYMQILDRHPGEI